MKQTKFCKYIKKIGKYIFTDIKIRKKDFKREEIYNNI